MWYVYSSPLSLFITLMKFCTVFILISLLLLLCTAASSDKGGKNEKLPEKEEKEEETVAEVEEDNAIKKNAPEDGIENGSESKAKGEPEWEVPKEVFVFFEGLFVIIGIAVAYRCFKGNEGHVTEEEWQEMNGKSAKN